jgi:hypothetical protein
MEDSAFVVRFKFYGKACAVICGSRVNDATETVGRSAGSAAKLRQRHA